MRVLTLPSCRGEGLGSVFPGDGWRTLARGRGDGPGGPGRRAWGWSCPGFSSSRLVESADEDSGAGFLSRRPVFLSRAQRLRNKVRSHCHAFQREPVVPEAAGARRRVELRMKAEMRQERKQVPGDITDLPEACST